MPGFTHIVLIESVLQENSFSYLSIEWFKKSYFFFYGVSNYKNIYALNWNLKTWKILLYFKTFSLYQAALVRFMFGDSAYITSLRDASLHLIRNPLLFSLAKNGLPMQSLSSWTNHITCQAYGKNLEKLPTETEILYIK